VLFQTVNIECMKIYGKYKILVRRIATDGT
jgi:hypothetical protein